MHFYALEGGIKINHKNIILTLAILFVILLAASTVSATDNVTDDINNNAVASANENITNDIGVDDGSSLTTNNQCEESISTANQVDEVGTTNEDELSITTYSSYTNLYKKISNSGDELTLDKDYYFIYYDTDSNYQNGVSINKKITINGNGATISGSNKARGFEITADDVVLKNIKFVDCFSSKSGGAIHWSGANGVLENCTFFNFHNNGGGGAIFWTGTNGVLKNCSFERIYTSIKAPSTYVSTGGAIYWTGAEGTLENCSFKNCYSSSSTVSSGGGGAVYWPGTNGVLKYCDFTNCYSYSSNSAYTPKGGAVCWGGTGGTLTNSNFVNCTVYCGEECECYGGAIYWGSDNSELNNCNLIDCYCYGEWYSGSSGGAIYVNGEKSTLSNLNFSKCYARISEDIDDDGGTLYWNGAYGTLDNCSFDDCYNSIKDGVITWNGDNGVLKSCKIKFNYNNPITYAISWKGNYGNLKDFSIVNCNSTSCIYWSARGGIVNNANFTNCFGLDNYIIYWTGHDGIFCNTQFINCFGAKQSVVYWTGNNGLLSYANFTNCSSTIDKNRILVYGKCTNNVVGYCRFNNNDYNYETYCFYAYPNKAIPEFSINNNTLENNGELLTFDVTPLRNNITVYVYDITNGKRLQKHFVIPAESLTHLLILDNLDIGNYLIELQYSGDAFYQDITTDAIFSIGQDPSVNISKYGGNIAGDDLYITITLNNDSTGNVKISLFNKTIIDSIDSYVRPGEVTFPFYNIIGGSHSYTIVYEGDSKYNPLYITQNLNIEYKNATITLNVKNESTYGEELLLNYNITKDCKGILSILVDDIFVTNMSVGDKFTLDDIDVGKHNITVIYHGDDYHNPCQNTFDFTVNKINTTIQANVKNSIYGENVLVNVTASENGEVTIQLGNITKHIDVEANKLTSVNFGILNAKSYTVNVTFNAGNNYKESYNYTSLTVLPAQSRITEIQAPNYSYGENIVIQVKTNVEGILTATINAITKEVDVNADQLTNLDFGILDVNNYEVKLSFNAGNNYISTNASKTFIVSKIDPTISVEVINATYGQTAQIIVNSNAEGNATITIDSIRTYEDVLIINNQIVQDIVDIDVGIYSVKVTYNGNNNYNNKTYNAKLSITKAPSNVVAHVEDITYTNDTIINVEGSMAGTAIVKIDDKYVKDITVMANTVASISFDNIPVGKHNVSVQLKPSNNNYDDSLYNTSFTVFKKETNVQLNAKDFIYGEDVIVNVTASENGKIIITMGNMTKEVNVFPNTLNNINLGTFAADSYDVNVSFDAGNNYNKSSNSTKITINPKETYVTVATKGGNYKSYGENISIRVIASEKGVVEVKVDDTTKYVDVEAMNITLVNFGILDAGIHNITGTFNGGNNYKQSSYNETLVIWPSEASITEIQYENYTYGHNASIKVKVNADGIISAKIANDTINVSVKANTLVPVNLGIHDVGTYFVTLTLDAGNNYYSMPVDTSIKIDPKQTFVIIDTTEYNDCDNVLVKVMTSDNGNLSIKLNNTVKNVIINNNVASFDFGVLPIGLYEVIANFTAGNNYIDSSASAMFKVLSKINDDDISISVLDIKAGQVNNIAIRLPGDATGTVNLKIGNDTYTFDVINGVANVKVPELAEGNYNFTITYSGDNKYSSFSRTNSISVTKIIPTTVTSSAITTAYNGGKYLVATLKDINGKPIVGVQVTINLNGVKYQTTDKNGQVKLSTNGLAPKTYTATITFAGNANYAKSTKYVKVTVKKATPKLTAGAKTFKKSVKTKKYTVTLKTNQNKVMKNTKVYLKVNKKTYTAKTNSKGVATFKITKLTKKGKYTAAVTYSGSSYYNKLTKNVKITIK